MPNNRRTHAHTYNLTRYFKVSKVLLVIRTHSPAKVLFQNNNNNSNIDTNPSDSQVDNLMGGNGGVSR